MVFSEHDEKYLNREGMDYLVERLKEKLADGSTDLTDYYNKEEINALLSEIQQGTDGKDGITPHIGDNGNWYLGDTDTGVKAQGEDGAKGDKGDTGEQGAQGEQGMPGADGVSPAITENADNSGTVYKLDITDASHTFTTPNLKGQDGSGGSGSVDLTDYYTKEQVDNLIPDISGKADKAHTHTLSDITDYVATDLSGYPTTEQVQTMIDEAIGGAIDGGY